MGSVKVDVATFIAWIDADQSGNSTVADFHEQRFRDELRPAYDAWLATEPLTNPAAPPTPFAMDAYQRASRDEAERLDTVAEPPLRRFAWTSSGPSTTCSPRCSTPSSCSSRA